MIKWILAGIAVLMLLLAPVPWPFAREIATVSTGKLTVRYYFRPAGIVGAITTDNPWVYAQIHETVSGHTRVVSIWADTPCDGAWRLSGAMSLPRPACADANLVL
jgi:hypothetical protein